jgi:hypothetical protein
MVKLLPKKRGPGRPPGAKSSKANIEAALSKTVKLIGVLDSYEPTPERDLIKLLLEDILSCLEREVE